MALEAETNTSTPPTEVADETAAQEQEILDKTATGSLSDDDILSGPLRYPIENVDRYQGFIKFSQYEIEAPTFGEATAQALKDGVSSSTEAVSAASSAAEESSGGFFDAIGDAFEALVDVFTGKDDDNVDTNISGQDPSQDQAITSRRMIGKGDPITLYTPVALTFNDNLQYDNPSLGVVGAAMGETMVSQGGGLLSALDTAVTQGFKSVSDTFSGSAKTGDLARLALIRGLSKVPGAGNVQEGASIAAGVTINPNQRSSFKGVNLREFSFQFKFIPKSKEESKVVEDIIRRFRFAAYPETLDASGSVDVGGESVGASVALGYKFPDLFDIQIKYKTKTGEVQVGHKFLKCFLKNIATNYNPGSMAFHKDGKPVEIDLTLNFIEEKTLDRRSISQGY